MLCDNLEGVGGGPGGRGQMYPYGWFTMLLYGRNQHNTEAIILQLKTNFKK